MNFWNDISTRLDNAIIPVGSGTVSTKVNNHIHTPYSYSAFDSIDRIISRAKEENISVLGINDFNTVDGFREWAAKCFGTGIFPLFNIEMIGLNRADQENGLRINDPNNPGRTYISGKGLAYPSVMSVKSADRLRHIKELSNDHVYSMTQRINDILVKINEKLSIDFDEMSNNHTRGMVRERHLAGMIRINIEKIYPEIKDRREIFKRLLEEDIHADKLNDRAWLENLIRSRLLKAGGPAFIEEDPDIFIEPDDIRDIILDAGGIPTYPFLADYSGGLYTDFEADKEKAAEKLTESGFYSAEFIPARNRSILLREYVLFLYEKGFIVTFGTEHNAPGEKPVEVFLENERKLDDELLRINYEGACVLAAHQYLNATEGRGYLDEGGQPRRDKKEEFINLGDRLIKMTNKGLYEK